MTTVIIVSGAPASGKSVLSKWLSQELGLHLLSKDLIKEKLFDELGCETREKSIELGKASFAILLEHCRDRVLTYESFIVESAFRKCDGAALTALFQNYRIIHVNCLAPAEAIIARFELRAFSGDRHPGHLDTENVGELSRMLEDGIFDIVIPGAIRADVHTTDFSSQMYSVAKTKVLHEYAN